MELLRKTKSDCKRSRIMRDWSTAAFVQYEQWKFPLLASSLQKNITTSLQFTYWPHFYPH